MYVKRLNHFQKYLNYELDFRQLQCSAILLITKTYVYKFNKCRFTLVQCRSCKNSTFT